MSETSMVESKPCPFCGNENVGFLEENDTHVWCGQCDASGPMGTVADDKAFGYEQSAIKAWNTRAALSPEAKTGEGRE